MLAAARAAARAGVPYVIAPRGMLIRDLISRKSRWVKSAWIHLFERRTLAEAAAVHVTAEIEGKELRELQLPARAIACIPNGVDTPAEHASLAAGPYGSLPERYVLFLSRINWKKGLDRLIKAWQWVPDVPLVIAGNDDEGYQPKLEELARSLGMADRVIFLGPVRDAHKWALYEQAQLFVLPSYSENFGNVVAEAMAMGCPVAVTPEVGIAPLVEATGAGLVVDGEPEKLAAGIRKLLADPQRRLEMGRRGAEAARTQLSWNGVVASTEALYGRVLDRSIPSSPAVAPS
jgi:glycosyltransferase involved in cell wall biosynthesis